MSRWYVIETQGDPLTHIIEAPYGGAFLKFCTQVNVLKPILYRASPALQPLTCLICAAYWSPP